jgi:hypothetical protein
MIGDIKYDIAYSPEFGGYIHMAVRGDKYWQQLLKSGSSDEQFIWNALRELGDGNPRIKENLIDS